MKEAGAIALAICFMTLSMVSEVRANPLIPKEDGQADGDACYNLDIESQDALWSCLNSPRDYGINRGGIKSPLEDFQWKFGPSNACYDMRGVFERLIIAAHTPVEGQNFAREMVDHKDWTKPNTTLPSCELMAEISYEVSGEYPEWADCVGYNPDEKLEHLVRCFVGQRMRQRKETETQAREYLTKQNKGCDKIRHEYRFLMADAFSKWFPSPDGGERYRMPVDIQPIECQELLTVNFEDYPVNWRFPQ